ncbi:MAG: hypothetical protein FWF03_06980 [Defluviitaleaceae bacterium]|nr:hypothetical protein [Defluviitaleaceae bacterium]
MKDRVKFAIIGAGSVSFCPATLADILLSERFNELGQIEIALMDILPEALEVSRAYCGEVAETLGKKPLIKSTTDLNEAVCGADFVVTAIEVDRYFYWSQDFHIPRRYGFKQIYGENGGPGGMFHFLRNVGPIVDIANATVRGAESGAWILNYTNPEAKLVDAASKLTEANIVGLCHGEKIGISQVASLIGIPAADIEAEAAGLNHFGWFTKLRRKSDESDLYPLLREKEREADMLAQFDTLALPRLMFRAYGLWPYPGTNHIGEYIAWSDEFLASAKAQFFFDPAADDPWKSLKVPEFIYSYSQGFASRPLFAEAKDNAGDPSYAKSFGSGKKTPSGSGEYGIPIAEAIFFDSPAEIGAVNVLNRGYISNVMENMAVEVPATACGAGLIPKQIGKLPTAVAAMISTQGAIHQLLNEAFLEGSRMKLLQALLMDPAVSSYNNAVALINEMFERQAGILPKLKW